MAEFSGNEDLFDSIVMADERWFFFFYVTATASRFVIRRTPQNRKAEKTLFLFNEQESLIGYVFCCERFYSAY